MVALPKGMEHVDREELYTSLPARVTYLQHFLEFGPDDVQALVSGQKYIKQVIPAIVNMVYKKLLRADITARVFMQRDSRNEENPEQWPTEDASLIQHRKMFLRWYLLKLNSDPTKMEYWEYLDKVGLMHVGEGRRSPLHVDYIFLGACLGYIQDSMTEAILSHPRLPLERKIALVRAIGKVIWIQNDLLARWHMEEGRELRHTHKEGDSEDEQREGFLHGKKVLGEESSKDGSSEGDDDSVGSSASSKTSLGRNRDAVEMPVRCPFSGLERQRAHAPKAPSVASAPRSPSVLSVSDASRPPSAPSGFDAPRLPSLSDAPRSSSVASTSGSPRSSTVPSAYAAPSTWHAPDDWNTTSATNTASASNIQSASHIPSVTDLPDTPSPVARKASHGERAGSGIPRLHVQHGKVVNKGQLEPNPFNDMA